MVRSPRLSGGRILVLWATCTYCGAPAPVMEESSALRLLRPQCCRIHDSKDARTTEGKEALMAQGLND